MRICPDPASTPLSPPELQVSEAQLGQDMLALDEFMNGLASSPLPPPEMQVSKAASSRNALALGDDLEDQELIPSFRREPPGWHGVGARSRRNERALEKS